MRGEDPMRIRENDMSRGQKMKICSLGNCIVNNYLIPCDEGYILIDIQRYHEILRDEYIF